MEWMTLILSILVGFLGIYNVFLKKSNIFAKSGILHLTAVPIVGNMIGVLCRRCTFADAIDKAYRLNDEARYVGFWDFDEPIIVIRSPELIKDIAVKYFDHFVDHRYSVDSERDPVFANTLFSLRGDKWRDTRHLLTPAFTGSKLKSMFKIMSDRGKDFADFLAQQSETRSNVVELKDVFTRYTNDVIAACTLGINVDSMRNPENELYLLGRASTNFEGSLSFNFFLQRNFPKISKCFKMKLVDRSVQVFFDRLVRECIETREREGIDKPDILQLMMGSRQKNAGSKLTVEEMTAQIFDLFFGGFDTSASCMCFTAYELMVNSDCQKKVQNEIDAILQDTNGEPSYGDFQRMPYLEAVINETLRLYPIFAFMGRLCIKRFELPPALPGAKSVMIEPGQNVWFPAYSIHRDSKYYLDPHKFDPERFINGEQSVIDPFTYFPFGRGPRMCIATRFSLLETKVALFHLLARCNLKPMQKTAVPLELSKSSFGMTITDGFWVRLEARDGLVEKQTVKVDDAMKSNECAAFS